MFLVECILYGRYKYWLAKEGDRYFWTGIKSNGLRFHNLHIATDRGKTHCKTEFTIEKVFE